MRVITLHPRERNGHLDVGPEALDEFGARAATEVDDALSACAQQHVNYMECLRQYEGVPKNPIRNVPFENAPNYEVTLGAIQSDLIYAQAIDLIFNQVSPLVTCRATQDDKQLADDVKAFQRWVDVCARTEWGIREAANQVGLDWVQLGTGAYLSLWGEKTKKTRVYTVKDVGARVYAHPIEDVIVPGGASHDPQMMPWIGLRYWLSESELEDRARRLGWNIEGFQACGNVGWVRSKREMLGRTNSSKKIGYLYEVIDLYCEYDIDDDGIKEDLLVTWDRTSRKVGKLRYNPYDTRPIRCPRFQERGHLFHGLGPLEMLQGYQEELTESHNDAAANSKLANIRMYKGPPGVVPGGVVRVFSGKYFEVSDPKSIEEMKCSDVYPSAYRNEAEVIAFAENRVGTKQLSGPSPAKMMGGRTPGITALSVIQQTNQRFAPAFDSFRAATAGALWECVLRYREQLKGGNRRAEKNIEDVIGLKEATRVIQLLKSPRFEDMVAVELTATAASVSKAQDKQDMLLLTMQILIPYYEKALQMVAVASQPNTPPPVQQTALDIAKKVSEAMDRALRTYDQVRDPSTFILDLESSVQSITAPQGDLQQLMTLLQQGGAEQAPAAGLPTDQPSAV